MFKEEPHIPKSFAIKLLFKVEPGIHSLTFIHIHIIQMDDIQLLFQVEPGINILLCMTGSFDIN